MLISVDCSSLCITLHCGTEYKSKVLNFANLLIDLKKKKKIPFSGFVSGIKFELGSF